VEERVYDREMKKNGEHWNTKLEIGYSIEKHIINKSARDRGENRGIKVEEKKPFQFGCGLITVKTQVVGGTEFGEKPGRKSGLWDWNENGNQKTTWKRGYGGK